MVLRHKQFQGLYSYSVGGFTTMGTGQSSERWVEIDCCYRAPSWSGLGAGGGVGGGVWFDSRVAQLLHPLFDTRTIGPPCFSNHFSSSQKALLGLELLSAIQCFLRESICTFRSSQDHLYVLSVYSVSFIHSDCQYKLRVTLKAKTSRISKFCFEKSCRILSYFQEFLLAAIRKNLVQYTHQFTLQIT
jgi:hypothetical protein